MLNRPRLRLPILAISLALIVTALSTAYAQGTTFTYQGRVTDSENPADGTFDMQFKLFTTASVGTGIQRGGTITNPMVDVDNGIFTVQLNFGACAPCFDGSVRFLEISIRPAGSPAAYTILSPRQPVTATPYAMRSTEAEIAGNADQLEGIRASGFIQNTTSQQMMTNFNIGGNGTIGGVLSAETVNAGMQYDIGGQRVFSISGTDNVIAGKGAGVANPDGSLNSYFGAGAGAANQMGSNNAFFGAAAGALNTVSGNSFFGSRAGDVNTTGTENAFFGFNAGGANQIGGNNSFFRANAGAVNTVSGNSFFGAFAGDSNTTGTSNAFFGASAGQANVTGSRNSYFGSGAGLLSSGSDNSFFGASAGDSNTDGANNSFFGRDAGQANQSGLRNSFFGAGAGNSNINGLRNSFFGYMAGQANENSCCNAFFGANAGFHNQLGQSNAFFGSSAGSSNIDASFNAFFGDGAGFNNVSGDDNCFFGEGAGVDNTSGARNSFFGKQAGRSNITGSNNTVVGAFADVTSGALNFATAIGAGTLVSTSNSVVLGRAADTVRIPGSLIISTLGAATATNLCRNGGLVSICSSSLRYKDQLAPFTAGLELINRLRPITFNWKQSGERDLGLGAEEVAAVEPLLVTYNERGQVEGVKYDRINIALINAVRQQQEQIAQQQELIKQQDANMKQQRADIDALKKLVCKSHPDADICK